MSTAISPDSVNNALLLASLPTFNSDFLTTAITTAATEAKSRLVIVLFSALFNQHQHISHTDQWNDVQQLLTIVYVKAFSVAQARNKILMDIDVLLLGLDEKVPNGLGHDINIVFTVSGDSFAEKLATTIKAKHVSLHPGDHTHESVHVVKKGKPDYYNVVAVAGTFDHLHPGHKILLSMSAWIASKTVIIGVTGDGLLKNKAFKEVLEPLHVRKEKALAFLKFFKPSLNYEFVEVNDAFGPTLKVKDIDALVVSEETKQGGVAINEARAKIHFPHIELFVIDVISATSPNLDSKDIELLKKTKLSSTEIRKWIVEHQKHQKH